MHSLQTKEKRDQPLILTIDDEEVLRECFCQFLMDYDYDVIQAENGRIGLELIDEGVYDKSWGQASEHFRKIVKKEQWEKAMKAGRRPLGEVVSRKFKSKRYTKQLPDAPDGEYTVIQFDTSFKNGSEVVETVTSMLEKDGQWRVSDYRIKRKLTTD